MRKVHWFEKSMSLKKDHELENVVRQKVGESTDRYQSVVLSLTPKRDPRFHVLALVWFGWFPAALILQCFSFSTIRHLFVPEAFSIAWIFSSILCWLHLTDSILQSWTNDWKKETEICDFLKNPWIYFKFVKVFKIHDFLSCYYFSNSLNIFY